jgi:hypothetical protein
MAKSFGAAAQIDMDAQAVASRAGRGAAAWVAASAKASKQAPHCTRQNAASTEKPEPPQPQQATASIFGLVKSTGNWSYSTIFVPS